MAAMSKADYLKRYLSGSEQPEKKKRKKKKVKANVIAPRVKIVDDDVDLKTLAPEPAAAPEESEDETPTVADYIDERPEDVQLMEKFKQDNRWKTVPEKTSAEKASSRIRHDSDSDESPARKQRHDSDSDQSPARKQRHDSDSDQSPARKQRHDSDSDHSPVRRKRHDSSDSDQSPPRERQESPEDKPSRDRNQSKSRSRKHSVSPPRRKRHDSGSDQSPPRRKRKDSDSDQSPPRRKHKDSDSDMSPPRRNPKGSDSDQSPPRKKSKDGDLSPPRRSKAPSQQNRRVQQPRKLASGRWSDTDDQGRATTMSSGAKAGLSSATDMRKEAMELKKKEKDMFDKMGSEKLGKDAQTVFRDKKSGKRRNLEEEEEIEAEKAALKALDDKKYAAWGKGLKQLAEKEAFVQAALHEASKPVARFRDDADLDAAQREMDREGDPMLKFIKRKKEKQQSKGPVKPRYRGPEPPPNRFGIWPGYRWDGVDRSNGFESKYFASLADKKTLKEEAHKWSIENM